MNDNGFEFGEAFARNTDPDTSHMAADEVSPHVRDLQLKVLAYAADRGLGGFIDPDMNEDFGVTSSTYRTRRSELVAKGMIEDTGERLAIGGAGRKPAVWRISDKGWAVHLASTSSGVSKAA
jgi:hypothetical protein